MTTRSVLGDCADAGPESNATPARVMSERRSMTASLWAVVSDASGWRPARFFVERIDRPRQPGPSEVRQDRRRQARTVDFVDLTAKEELVETAPEVAAALDHDHPRLGDVQPEHLELHRVHALAAVGDDHELDAAEVEQSRGAHVGRYVLQHAAAADILAVAQLGDLGLAVEGQGEFLLFLGVEGGGEDGAFTQLVRLGGDGGVVEHAEEHVLGAGGLERAQEPGGVAAPAAARIV